MSRTAAALATLAVLAAAIFGFLLWQENRGLDPQLPAPEQQAAAPAEPAPVQDEPEILHPVPEPETAEEPIPELDESDATFRGALSELIGGGTFKNLFYPQAIVRRIVVTIDNLPREVVSDRLRPVKPAEGSFLVEREGEQARIAEKNAARYTPYVRALEQVDIDRFSRLYVRFYPLFQAAYRDLGYPKGYFNDRLVTVIDHMLAAPELDGPVALVQPHVFYRYADRGLESASAGHKLMWRIGNKNAARVKAKLRQIRAAVAANTAR
jgi:hypothetical protein